MDLQELIIKLKTAENIEEINISGDCQGSQCCV